MSRREILIGLLIVAIGASAVIWFLSTHEKVTVTVHTGFQGEARRNPWLAAQRLLDSYDRPATEIRKLTQLNSLPPRATLVIPKAHFTITGHLRSEITNWVRQGGYLIVEAEYPLQDDPLVDGFGVNRQRVELDQDVRSSNPDKQAAHNDVELITLPDAITTARVRLDPFMVLNSEQAWYHYDGQYGTYLLTKPVGRGVVTIVNDLDFARNSYIGELDHAQFFLDLVRLRGKFAASTGNAPPTGADHVLIFNEPGKPSLLQWLRENAWAPLAGAAAAILLWLWKVVPRFGPIMPDIDRNRRRLLDHLRASGRFLWSNGHSTRLLEASRDACVRQIARSLPQFMSTAPQARPQLLMQALDLTEEQTHRILQPQSTAKMLPFWQTIRLYQRVYARLGSRRGVAGANSRRSTH